jgi:hypothetical protein
MDEAVKNYGKHSSLSAKITVWSDGRVPTAETTPDRKNIRFGSNVAYQNTRTAMHELGHVFGVGLASKWKSLVKDGKYTGSNGLKKLQSFDGKNAVLHADEKHFWPYGFQQDNEFSQENIMRHVAIVAAMQADLK